MIEIRMMVAGSEIIFRRCGHCEAQSWQSADGSITLQSVLELARG